MLILVLNESFPSIKSNKLCDYIVIAPCPLVPGLGLQDSGRCRPFLLCPAAPLASSLPSVSITSLFPGYLHFSLTAPSQLLCRALVCFPRALSFTLTLCRFPEGHLLNPRRPCRPPCMLKTPTYIVRLPSLLSSRTGPQIYLITGVYKVSTMYDITG